MGMTTDSPPVTGIGPSANSSVAPVLGRPEEVGFAAQRLARLDAAMQAKVDDGRFAGISLAVARHGQLVYAKDFGVQDITTGAALRSDAVFRIASMTKPVTGVAMLLLYEEGKWQLDDPVALFLPEFADLTVLDPGGRLVPPVHPMTMRELITNTGGISGDAGVAGQFANGPGNEVRRLYLEAGLTEGTIADMVAKIAAIPLATQPGTQFQYGLSQDVQGRIVEVLSGQRLDEFLRTRIFEPLRMPDTGFAVRPNELHRLVPLAAYDGSLSLAPSRLAWPAVLFGDGHADQTPRFLSGGGGLYSTLADYLRFAQMLGNRGELDGVQILAGTSVGLMASNLLPVGVPVEFRQRWAGQGYGVDVGVILDPGRATFTGGPIGTGTFHWSGAHGTWFWVDPTYDIVVVGMVQQEFAGIVHMGIPHPAPDLRALSRSLIYQALTDPAA
jgi:CubicO group peptidase (beta-lactamase class C family)